ncbi:MAG: acyl-CoA dehydrogenase family protein [Candidatus Hadarchaeales archaeon]
MPTADDFTRPVEWIPDVAQQFAQMIRDFGERRYRPLRRKIDEDWREHKIVEPLLKEVLVDLGMSKALWPEEYGGLGLPREVLGTMTAVMSEELGRLDSGFAVSVLVSMWPMVMIAVEPHRNQRLIEEFAPKFCGEELYVGCNAMTEPQGGSDIENLEAMKGRTIRTTARLEGDEWVIRGHKIWPTNSGKIADLFGVVCTTNPSAGEEGMAYIYVPADAEGVKVGEPYQKAGMAADMNTDIWFEDVRVPAYYRAHGPGLDAKYFRELITIANIATAGFSVGVIKDTYEILKRWVDERVVAGKPLKEHSISAVNLSEIATAAEICTHSLYMAARMYDHPEVYGEPWSEKIVAKTRAVSLFCSDQAVHCTNRAMELMGSYGYSREFDVEKHWRDSKMLTLWMGGRQLDMIEITRYFFDCQTL